MRDGFFTRLVCIRAHFSLFWSLHADCSRLFPSLIPIPKNSRRVVTNTLTPKRLESKGFSKSYSQGQRPATDTRHSRSKISNIPRSKEEIQTTSNRGGGSGNDGKGRQKTFRLLRAFLWRSPGSEPEMPVQRPVQPDLCLRKLLPDNMRVLEENHPARRNHSGHVTRVEAGE